MLLKNFLFAFLILFTLFLQNKADSHLNRESISNSELRRGFEGVFTITNWFIDLLKPVLPSVITDTNILTLITDTNITDTINLATDTDEYIDKVMDYFTKGSWQEYAKKAFAIFPGGCAFIIISVVIMIFVPLIGLIYCCANTCCKCCCEKQPNPFDNENDNMLRKVLVASLFVLLLLLLLLIVVLFTTDTNASKAFKNSSLLVGEQAQAIKDYLTGDVQNFTINAKNALDELKDKFVVLLNGTIEKMIEQLERNLTNQRDNVKDKINTTLLLKLNLMVSINELISNPNSAYSQWWPSVENLSNALNSDPSYNSTGREIFPFQKLPAFQVPSNLASLTNQLNDINGVVPLTEAFDSIKNTAFEFTKDSPDEVRSFMDSVKNIITDIDGTVNNAVPSISDFQTSANNFTSQYTKYYDYVYYVFIGVSAFISLLLVLLTFGCLGIFCRRPSEEYSQCCHRGVSANFLMAAVGLFFIFVFILMLTCLILFAFGFLARQFVCLPLTQLDDNDLVKILRKLTVIQEGVGDISLKNVISECRSSDSLENVDELNRLLQQKFSYNFKTLKNTTFFIEEFDNQLEVFFNETNIPAQNIQNIFNLEDFFQGTNVLGMANMITKFDRSLSEHDKQLINVKNVLNIFPSSDNVAEALKSTRNLLANYELTLNTIKKDYETFAKFQSESSNVVKNLSDEINQFVSIFSDETRLTNFLLTIAKDVLADYTTIGLEMQLNKTLTNNFKTFLNCKILSNVYDDVTLSVCFEYVDNFNGFWLALWASLIILVFTLPISIKLARLLRKFYSYEESLGNSEYSPRRSKGPYLDSYARRTGDLQMRPVHQFHVKNSRVYPIHDSTVGDGTARRDTYKF